MDRLRNSTHEALRLSHALFPWQLKRSLEEEKRVGFFKNAYRNARKAYFDRQTTQSEFCFEINILCDRRSVQWRTMKFEVRRTALQNKLTLTNSRAASDFIKFYAVLELFEANSGQLQNFDRLHYE